jgi:hypothetical protein
MEAPADPKASVAPPSPCVGTAIAGPCVDVPMTSPPPDPNDSEATPGEAASEPTAKASRELFATREDVQVFARVRPHLSSEDASHSFVAVAEGSVSVSGAGGRCHSSKVDRAFPQGTTQHEVFGHIVPLIDSVLAGFNASVIAYGQTGSGIPLDVTRTRHTPAVSLALNMEYARIIHVLHIEIDINRNINIYRNIHRYIYRNIYVYIYICIYIYMYMYIHI